MASCRVEYLFQGHRATRANADRTLGADCTPQLSRIPEEVMKATSKQSHKSSRRPTAPRNVANAASDADSPSAVNRLPTVDPMALHQALVTVTPMLRDIAEQDFIPIRLDSPTIAMCLLNRLRSIEPYRETIAILPLVRQDWLTHLEPIALALIHVDSLSKITIKESPAVRATFQEASRLRARLRGPVAVLQQHGLLPNALVTKQEGKRGYVQTAQDLMLFGNLLRDHWNAIAGCTAITIDEVDRCSVLAQMLFRNAESRKVHAALPADLDLLKRQVYTLFLLAYDELRRCLEFIERGAADRVAPTLYQGRGRKPGAAKVGG